MGSSIGEVMLEVGIMINGAEQKFQMSSTSTSMCYNITGKCMTDITQLL